VKHHSPPPPINYRAECWALAASLLILAAIIAWIVLRGGH
jgi:hypothetical protein